MNHFDPYGLWGEMVGKFFSGLTYMAFCGLEWAGANLVPLPGLNDLVESAGRWGAGGRFGDKSRYHDPENRIIRIPGTEVPGLSHTHSNGLGTNCAQAIEQAKYISGANNNVQVDLLYNGTNGLVLDFLGCLASKFGCITPFNKMCSAYYNSMWKEDPNHRFKSSVHSRAGICIMNTGKLLTPEQRNRIDVISYGSGTLIPNDYFGSATNNVSRIDFVPMTNPLAFILGHCSSNFNVNYLTPSTLCPFKEHGLLEKTYADRIKAEGYHFINEYFPERENTSLLA